MQGVTDDPAAVAAVASVTSISPKRSRAAEAAHALLLQAHALLASHNRTTHEAEASSHLDACIASLNLELRPTFARTTMEEPKLPPQKRVRKQREQLSVNVSSD